MRVITNFNFINIFLLKSTQIYYEIVKTMFSGFNFRAIIFGQL